MRADFCTWPGRQRIPWLAEEHLSVGAAVGGEHGALEVDIGCRAVRAEIADIGTVAAPAERRVNGGVVGMQEPKSVTDGACRTDWRTRSARGTPAAAACMIAMQEQQKPRTVHPCSCRPPGRLERGNCGWGGL